ncbi:type II secretion system protein [Viridibacterium curvum]|uniref:Prepilin-type N-terminal cleavage/methylation domain-containing protein n=1 Tax=Viridibacterium curvum TaxID=1101404 RepID=A0ABP9QL08_9RHOO
MSPRRDRGGFTLIELLVVMAIIGVLLSIAAPRYFNHVEKAREGALKQSLAVMRDAIDKFYADTEHYPASLDELVERRYLRSLPEDPYTGMRDSWQTEAPPEGGEGVFDVRSGASGMTANGAPLGDL